jgi:CBS domain-containing protein
MSVGTLCNREVVVTDKDTSIAEAAELMRKYHVGDLVVLDDGDGRRPIGLITDRDIAVGIVAKGLDPDALSVADVMTGDLETVFEDADFWDALAHMRRHGVRRLPVVNDAGGLEGILTLDDALSLISEAMNDLVDLVYREVDREKSLRRV